MLNPSDIIESGGTDADGDNVADAPADLSNLPDTDGNGIPDFQEIIAGVEPGFQAANGAIRTGLEGSGCTLSDGSRDPLLPGVLILAILCLLGRTRQRRIAAALLPACLLGTTMSYSPTASADWMSDTGWFNQSGDQHSDASYSDTFTRGIYAGVGLGFSRLEPDTSALDGWDPNDRVNKGGQINIGIDLIKHLSLELHSADLGSAGLSPAGRINYHVNGASALLYAGGNRHGFMRRGLTAYGRLGYGALDNSPVGSVPIEKVNANHLLIGAGLEYMTRSGFGARAEVISFDKDAQYVQLGLIYRLARREEIQRIVEAPKPIPVIPSPEPVIAAAIEEPEIEYAPPPPPPAYKPDPCGLLSGVLEGVNFQNDSAQLTGTATVVLDDVAQTLKGCTSVPVTLAAHTDSVGSLEYNQQLSQRRAESVVDYLDNSGIDKQRLTPMAFGETNPLDSNETAQGRARNRRVELIAR